MEIFDSSFAVQETAFSAKSLFAERR